MPVNQGDIFAELDRISGVMKHLPTQVAAIAQVHFTENFDKGGWQNDAGGVDTWLPRKDKKNDRPTLIKTGNLRKSLTKFVNGTHISVQVIGPAARYADIHNFGGVIKHHAMSRVVDFTRAKGSKNMLAFAKRNSKRVVAQARVTYGEHETRMPQRRFIGPSRALDQKIQQFIEGQLRKR